MAVERILDGRYEVRELIGRGGMADVHLGRDLKLGRNVAVKVLRQDLARDPLFQSRFRREAQAVAGLNNPNIVSVYDTGEEEVSDRHQHEIRVPFIVMEYVEGLTLRDRVRAGDLTPEDSITYLSGVLGALDYSHKAGIVHRDIKPANVMITPDGAVKVMDFGIARAIADSQATMTQTQAVLGTAQYLSPEQARGETVDARSDLYSAGCLLFELLTGRPPFVGDSPVSVAYQHVREEPPRAGSLSDAVTPALDSVLAKALEKDREDRFQSAVAFRSALLDAARGISVPATAALTEAMDVAAPRTRTTSGAAAWGAAGLGAAAMAQGDPGTRSMERVAAERALPLHADADSHHTDHVDPDRFGVLGMDHDERDPDEREDRRRSSSRAAWITVFFIAVLLVLAGGYFVLNGLGGNDTAQEVTTVPVPDVVNRSEAEAVELLEDAELNPSTDEEYNATVEAGLVIRSDPAAGSAVAPGSRVNVVVSQGSANAVIPETLLGLTESSARDVLEGLELEGGEVLEENSATVDEGRVIRTEPRVGTPAPKGSAVRLWLSTGEVTVPLLTDLTIPEAELLLSDPNVQLRYRTENEENSVVAPGVIIAQSREAKSSVDQGTEIVLTVAVAPVKQPAPEPAPPSAPTAPSEPIDPAEETAPGAGESAAPGNGGGNGNGNGNGGNGNGSNTRPTEGDD